jgi:hypothetical protein
MREWQQKLEAEREAVRETTVRMVPKPRMFRREDGEVMVYPPFVAHAGGYSVVVWDDMDERNERRREQLARERAVELWDKAHGPDVTRYERRMVDDKPFVMKEGVMAVIDVRFSLEPLAR